MRKLTYFVACSADGFIAAEDGSVDAFLDDRAYLTELFERFPETCPGHLRELFGVRGESKQFGAVLMGRHTYKLGLEAGVSNPYPTLEQYVFSTTMAQNPDENVQLVSEDAAEFVEALKEKPGKDLWLAGGASLAASLFELVDELILKVNPVVLGAGIPLFSRPVVSKRLELLESETLPGGVPLLRYRATTP